MTTQSASEYSDLTPKEAEIWALMAEGLSNTGIARRLVVQVASVEKRVTELLWKLGMFHGQDPDCNRRVTAAVKYLDRADRPLNWYDMFKASGISIDDTTGDGVGRFVAADKAKILDALWARADRLEAGERDV